MLRNIIKKLTKLFEELKEIFQTIDKVKENLN